KSDGHGAFRQKAPNEQAIFHANFGNGQRQDLTLAIVDVEPVAQHIIGHGVGKHESLRPQSFEDRIGGNQFRIGLVETIHEYTLGVEQNDATLDGGGARPQSSLGDVGDNYNFAL